MSIERKKLLVIVFIAVIEAITAITTSKVMTLRGVNLMSKSEVKDSIFSNSSIKRTNEDVMKEIEPRVKGSLMPCFEKASVGFCKGKITMIVLKDEKKLELWAEKQGKWFFVKEYKVLAASGIAGPKLKEGDKQVPEGIYNITTMNPNSKYHLAMLVSYPNEFDKAKAKEDGRENLGGDICIHGKSASAGCVAVGDPASEELYYLAYKVGMKNIKVIIAPCDFREKDRGNIKESTDIKWLSELYDKIKRELKDYDRKSL